MSVRMEGTWKWQTSVSVVINFLILFLQRSNRNITQNKLYQINVTYSNLSQKWVLVK
jgi:hypothetical protein